MDFSFLLNRRKVFPQAEMMGHVFLFCCNPFFSSLHDLRETLPFLPFLKAKSKHPTINQSTAEGCKRVKVDSRQLKAQSMIPHLVKTHHTDSLLPVSIQNINVPAVTFPWQHPPYEASSIYGFPPWFRLMFANGTSSFCHLAELEDEN